MKNTFLTDKELINENLHDSSLSIIGIDISSLSFLEFSKVWPQLLPRQKLRLARAYEYLPRTVAMLNSAHNKYIMCIWLLLIRLERIHERCTLFLDYDLQKIEDNDTSTNSTIQKAKEIYLIPALYPSSFSLLKCHSGSKDLSCIKFLKETWLRCSFLWYFSFFIPLRL